MARLVPADILAQFDGDLRRAHLFAVLFGKMPAEFHDVFLERLVGKDVVNETHEHRLIGAHSHVGHDQISRPVTAANAREPADAVGGRQDAEQTLRKGIVSAFRRERPRKPFARGSVSSRKIVAGRA